MSDGGYELRDAGSGRVDLVVTDTWSSSARDQIVSGKADGVVLNYALGYKERSLQFLDGLPLRRLQILARALKDLSPVLSLRSTLESISIQTHPSAELDLRGFEKLTDLGADWDQIKRTASEATHLEKLFIMSYDEPDFWPLATLHSLSSLRLKQYTSVRDLAGIEHFPWLQELAVHTAYWLEDMSALRDARSPILTHLQLTEAKRVTDISPIASCEGLILLNLEDGGVIESISPLRSLKSLETLLMAGSITIQDGDLTPLRSLPKLTQFAAMNRRHYRPTTRQIEAELLAR